MKKRKLEKDCGKEKNNVAEEESNVEKAVKMPGGGEMEAAKKSSGGKGTSE